MQIIYSLQFKREYQRLPDFIKGKAERREKIFRINPFNSRLKTHKLGGRLSDFWSFSIDYRYRIVFEFKSKDKIIFHIVGDHSVYKRL